MSILEVLRARLPRHAVLRRDLHAHPETAFEEARTAALVAECLIRAGVEVHSGLAGTGVVGVLRGRGQSSRAIGLRADMDALPIIERNTFAHCSRHLGKMHACGHDGHTAMLLAAAEYLAETREFDGTVYFVFQPAEESQGGGRVMVEEGLFSRFPMDAVFGLHNWPGLPQGTLAVHDGPVMAGADEFEIEITGLGAHGAMPHQGVDPIVIGAALVQALQTVVSRSTDPLDAAVVSVTQFHAGHATNVIPDQALLRGTVRAFRAEVQERLEARMQSLCAGVGAAWGAKVVLNYKRGYPATVNTRAEADICRLVAAKVLGHDQVRSDLKPSMGAEDFSYLLLERPGCYVWLGNDATDASGTTKGGCKLHNPLYDFNDELIPLGAGYWVALAEHILAPA